LKYQFDPKAGIILVKTKVHGPRGDAIVNLALDTGATWTLVSWETAVLVGYDPASIQQRTAITTGSGIEYCPKLNLLRVERETQRGDVRPPRRVPDPRLLRRTMGEGKGVGSLLS